MDKERHFSKLERQTAKDKWSKREKGRTEQSAYFLRTYCWQHHISELLFLPAGSSHCLGGQKRESGEWRGQQSGAGFGQRQELQQGRKAKNTGFNQFLVKKKYKHWLITLFLKKTPNNIVMLIMVYFITETSRLCTQNQDTDKTVLSAIYSERHFRNLNIITLLFLSSVPVKPFYRADSINNCSLPMLFLAEVIFAW